MITLVSHWLSDVIRRLSHLVSATRINKRIWIAAALVGWGDRLLFCPIRIWGGHWGWINKQTEMPSFLCLTYYTQFHYNISTLCFLPFNTKTCPHFNNEFINFESINSKNWSQVFLISFLKIIDWNIFEPWHIFEWFHFWIFLAIRFQYFSVVFPSFS